MKIIKAKATVDYFVRFWLDNGRYVDRDFSLVRGPVFDPIWNDPRKFRRVRVIDGVPTWPGDVDVAPEGILRGGEKGRIPKIAIIGARGTLISAKAITSL